MDTKVVRRSVAVTSGPLMTATEPTADPLPSRSTLGKTIADAVTIVATTLGLLVATLRLWEANLRVPFVYNARNRPPLVYGPDAPYYVMLTKSLIDHGSYLRNPSLGWPFSFQTYDNPEGADNLQLAALRALGFALRDAVLTVNIYYLLTFVAVSLTAWFVLRKLGVSRLVAGVVAILYSFLPYHFARGEGHLLLSGYFTVPIATMLILRVLSDQPPFTTSRGPGWRLTLRSRGALVWFLGCAVLASTGPYYAFFTMLLVAAGVVIDVAARREWRTAASGAVAVGTVLVVLLLNLAPSFLYWHGHGTNRVVTRRGPSETEVNGLRVSQLVLPREEHRIGVLADLQRKSDRFSPVGTSERGQQLGLIGALGLLGMMIVTLSRVLRRPRSGDAGRGPPQRIGGRVEVVQRLGAATVLAVLFGTVSGFSLLISGLGLKEIRSWNRISIFIGFFALIAVAFALDWLVRRLPRWRGHALLTLIVCLAVLGVGVLDQTAPADVPRYRGLERAWNSDDTFMHRIARELGPGAAVFQLPYVFFPEAGMVEGTGPHDQVRGWLHADSLRWSWGAVRGRDHDWQASVVKEMPSSMLDALTAVGFTGVMIDRAGYQDRAGLLDYALTQALKQRPQQSADRRLLFYDLRPRMRDVRVRLGAAGVARLRRSTLAGRTA